MRLVPTPGSLQRSWRYVATAYDNRHAFSLTIDNVEALAYGASCVE